MVTHCPWVGSAYGVVRANKVQCHLRKSLVSRQQAQRPQVTAHLTALPLCHLSETLLSPF